MAIPKAIGQFIWKLGYEGSLYAMENYCGMEVEEEDPVLYDKVIAAVEAVQKVHDHIRELYGIDEDEYEMVTYDD